MENNKIVSRNEWIEARKQLLEKEKELTRLQDKLSAERRQQPWVKVEKNYVFDGGRSSQRQHRAPCAPRCDAAGRLPSSNAQDRSVQEAHGLALQVGILIRERL